MPRLAVLRPARPEKSHEQRCRRNKRRERADKRGREIKWLAIQPHDFGPQDHRADRLAFPRPHPDVIRDPDPAERGAFDFKPREDRAHDYGIDSGAAEAIPETHPRPGVRRKGHRARRLRM